MKKFYVFEFSAISSIGLSLAMVNEILQTVALILAVVSGFFALRQSLKSKSKTL